MPKDTFTAAKIKAWLCTPPARERTETDASTPGLYLRRYPSGAATYIARATVDGRRAAPVKIGDARALSLKDARAAAARVHAKAALGEDVAATRAERRAETTLGELAARYFDSRAHAAKTDQTRYQDEHRIRLHILHRLESRRLSEVTPQTVRKLAADIETDTRTGKRGHRIGGPGVAAKAVRSLSAMLSHAVEIGELKRNPIPGAVKLMGSGTRDAVLESADDYRRLFETLDQLARAYERGDAVAGIRPAVRDAIVLLAVTGMRRGEVQALTWAAADFEAGLVKLAATKGARLRAQRTGGKARSVTVAVPSLGMAALARRLEDARTEGRDELDDLCFPPAKRGTRIALDRDWRKVREAAGFDAELTLHGLRHSVGTAAALQGLDSLAIQRLLRHSNPATTGRYIHAAAERERLADRVMAGLLGDVGDKAPGA